MHSIKLPNGGTIIHMGSEAEAADDERLFAARHRFAQDYCRERGWPVESDELSIEQILEIRKQDGWKNPSPGDAE